MLLKPPRAAGVRLSQQRVEIDRVRRSELLGRLDGDRAAGGGLQAKAHDGLVHGADLLHVERAVGDALAVENEQLLQHAVDDAVGDARRHDALYRLPDTAAAAALQKSETVRVEQCAAALRQVDGAPGTMGASPIVDEAKQHQKLRPGAEALVHGVGVEGCILAQALVEAGERVVAREALVFRQHPAFLRVEQKDQAQDDGEQAAIDIVAVAVLGERLAQEFAAGGVVSALEAAEEFVQSVQHLLGKALGNLVLVLAAAFEQGGEPLFAR